jgi:hypothetical protein
MRQDQKAALWVASASTVVLLACSFVLRMGTTPSILTAGLAGAATVSVVVPNKRRTLADCRDLQKTLQKLANTPNLSRSVSSQLNKISSELDRVLDAISNDANKLHAVDQVQEYLLPIVPPLERFVSLIASGLDSQQLKDFESRALPAILSEINQWYEKIHRDDLEQITSGSELVKLLSENSFEDTLL